MLTPEQQKEIAIECLKRLDIYKPYIQRFEKDSTPCFFERFAGFYADQEEVLWQKVKELQEKLGFLCYAITHDCFEFGECWSMLCVPRSAESIEDCLIDADKSNVLYAFSYVYNQSYPELSELGDIVVKSFGGGIHRIG